MIESLFGQVVDRGPMEVVLRVGGVAYALRVPVQVAEDLAGREDEVRIYTTLRQTEDQIRLYGFLDALERDLFEILIGISGVGPATALGLLSGLSLEAIGEAVRERDPLPLKRVKGVGQKTAERIVVELQGRLPETLARAAAAPTMPDASEDAVRALVALGYKAGPARAAVAKAEKSIEGKPSVAQLVRSALRYV